MVNGDPLTERGPVVVREYQDDAPAGLIGEWLDARQIPWRTSRPAQEPGLEPGAGAVIALGSSASAYWRDPPWIAAECDLLAAATQAGTPVLGVCFGAQALARALGGQVIGAQRPEVGWVRPVSDQPELTGPYLAWHFDAIELPPGAQALARTPQALQAYVQANAMGWQFHPEVTAGIWRDWAQHDPEAIRAEVADPAALAEEIAMTAEATRARTFALLDWWRRWLASRQP